MTHWSGSQCSDGRLEELLIFDPLDETNVCACISRELQPNDRLFHSQDLGRVRSPDDNLVQ